MAVPLTRFLLCAAVLPAAVAPPAPAQEESGAQRAQQEAPREHALDEQEMAAAREAIARAAKATGDVPWIEARFRQVQESLLLEEPLVSHGHLQLRTGKPCIVLRFEEPKRIVIRSDAHSHLVYQPERGKAERYVFRSNEVAKAIVSLFTSDIRRAEEGFVFTKLREVEKAVELTMEPREERAAELLPQLTIRFRARDGVPARIAYANRDGEHVTLALSEIQLVRKEKDLSRPFAVEIPKDVEVAVYEVREEDRGDGGGR